MAVWADIDEDDDPSSLVLATYNHHQPQQNIQEADQSHEHEGPASYVAYALRCYPIAEKFASYLDLTDLDALSLTCHAIHESLNQFAYQLKQHSLRCVFDVTQDKEEQEQQDAMLALQLSVEDEQSLGGSGGPAFPVSLYPEPQSPSRSALGLSGKVSKCARDLVAPCRNCGVVVCRNCIEKPPSNKMLPGRLRRLCDSCLEAPLILHREPLHEAREHQTVSSSASSTRSTRSDSSLSDQSDVDFHHTARTLSQMPELWLRDPCTCAEKGVYLCHQCGHSNRADDSIYKRVWVWRSKYSTRLGGGLGTGLGLGDQGQKCGRKKHCLATRDAMALMEAECSSEDVSTPTGYDISRSNTPITHDSDHDTRPEPGYFRQEIEGVGGKVKSKSKKLVKVGATVYEFRDERESGKYLGREARGDLRAWCSWCSRVCLGKQDRTELLQHDGGSNSGCF